MKVISFLTAIDFFHYLYVLRAIRFKVHPVWNNNSIPISMVNGIEQKGKPNSISRKHCFHIPKECNSSVHPCHKHSILRICLVLNTIHPLCVTITIIVPSVFALAFLSIYL